MNSTHGNPRRGLAHATRLALAAAAFSLPVTAFGNVVPVDTFATDQAILVDTTPANGGLSSSIGDGTDPSILGGARDIFVELLTQSPANPLANASAGVASGVFVFNVDAGATGTATVQWDGPDNSISVNPTGLGGIDLTQGGTATEFTVNTLFSDQGYEFAITAWSDANNWTTVTLLATGVTTPTPSAIPFAAFSICDASADGIGQVVSIECAGGSNPVNFSNLGALQLVVDPKGGTVSVDLILDSITTEGDQQEPLACRVTGGGVDTFNQWDGTTYETGEMNHNGVGKLPAGVDRYTFGGQAGANTALQPQPKGEWTHHQQQGPSGSFSFHAGTASAAAGTEIDKITCMDPGFCNPARPAPAKQIDFEGVGNFHNLGRGKDAPVFQIANATVATGRGNRGYTGTYHWFEVNIDDLGEPGVADKNHIPHCPPTGFGVKGAVELADCSCPDFYRITIYDGVYANSDGSITPNKTDVIYEVYGYIDGGNLQIHPLTGFDRK